MPDVMKAILVDDDGVLRWGETEAPTAAPGQVRIRVRATAVNRADLAQREGLYPPPPGASPILGLECAGEIDQLGEGVEGLELGQRVCALLAGGGYAQQVVCPAGHVLPVPDGMDLEDAAALPEVLTTAYLNLFMEAGVTPNEHVLLHAGGSGVGTCAIQLCRAFYVNCYVTAGSDEKIRRCMELGARAGANRHNERFCVRAKEWTGGHGFDVILDPIGAAYLDDDLRSLAVGGRLVIIGLMGGRRAELDLGRLLVKRQRIIGSVLRSRSDEDKTRILEAVRNVPWPLVASGEIVPVVHRILPLPRAQEAFDEVASNRTFGKLVLAVP